MRKTLTIMAMAALLATAGTANAAAAGGGAGSTGAGSTGLGSTGGTSIGTNPNIAAPVPGSTNNNGITTNSPITNPAITNPTGQTQFGTQSELGTQNQLGAQTQFGAPQTQLGANSTLNTTPGSNPGVPLAGANSFTQGQAMTRIQARGYSSVSGLTQDANGVWRGKAMKDGKQVNVAVDYQGNVVLD